MKTNKSVLTNMVLFVAILIILNLVSVSLFTRIDLSKGKIYSLSKASKKAVRDLDDRLVIKAYFTKNLPGELADARRFTQDLLSEYQAFSRGKLRFEFIDPSNEETLKEEAQKNQIFPATVRALENDKFEIREVYMGLVFLYQGKSESIPLVQNTRGLEYDITSMVKKISAKGLKKVAFFDASKDEVDPRLQMQGIQSNFSTARELLSGNYEVQDTDLTAAIDKAVDALVFTGTADSLSQDQLFNLDQFIMNGGKVVLFQEKVNVSLQEQKAETNQSNLFNLLKNYGISIKNNIVSDAECGTIQVQQQQGFFRIATPMQYPFMPVIHNMNKENVIVKNLDNVQMIFASEIDTTAVGADITVEPLMLTSSNSGETKGPRFDIGIMQFKNVDLKKKLIDDPKVIAGIFKGSFKSYFADKSDYSDVIAESPETEILVVTDSDFIKEGAGGGVDDNKNFFLNSVDYLAAESSLIEIRSREIAYMPLKELSNATRKVVKWLNILLPSILLILFGILHYRKELRNRKIIGELYE